MLPGFGGRAGINDILAGYAGRLVRSQNDLVLALANTSVQRIVFAESMAISQVIHIARPVELSALPASTVTVASGVDALFDVSADDVVIEKLIVSASSGTDFCVVSANIEGLTIQNCKFDAFGYLVDANGVTVTYGYIGANRMPQCFIRGGFTSSRFIGNLIGPGVTVTISSGAGNAITGNVGTGSAWNVTTSASSGFNVITGNAVVGTITAHANDVYQTDPTALTAQPLNT